MDWAQNQSNLERWKLKKRLDDEPTHTVSYFLRQGMIQMESRYYKIQLTPTLIIRNRLIPFHSMIRHFTPLWIWISMNWILMMLSFYNFPLEFIRHKFNLRTNYSSSFKSNVKSLNLQQRKWFIFTLFIRLLSNQHSIQNHTVFNRSNIK